MLKLDADEKKLHEQLAAAAADYAKAAELDAQLQARARGEGAGRGGVAGRRRARRGLSPDRVPPLRSGLLPAGRRRGTSVRIGQPVAPSGRCSGR